MEADKVSIKFIVMLILLAAAFCRPCSASGDRMTFFSFGRGGMCRYSCWSITVDTKGGATTISVQMTDEEDGDIDFQMPAEASLLPKIEKIAEKYCIEKWNGYKSKNGMFKVLDGDSFGLSVTYASGRTVLAKGYASFPEGFGKFQDEMLAIRDEALQKYRAKKPGK